MTTAYMMPSWALPLLTTVIVLVGCGFVFNIVQTAREVVERSIWRHHVRMTLAQMRQYIDTDGDHWRLTLERDTVSSGPRPASSLSMGGDR